MSSRDGLKHATVDMSAAGKLLCLVVRIHVTPAAALTANRQTRAPLTAPAGEPAARALIGQELSSLPF